MGLFCQETHRVFHNEGPRKNYKAAKKKKDKMSTVNIYLLIIKGKWIKLSKKMDYK